MVEHNIVELERLVDCIDNLLETTGHQIYVENYNQNLPQVKDALQGQKVEDEPVINLNSGDPTLDALFYYIIDPEGTRVNEKGGGETKTNWIWNDIKNNGLGYSQYELIARHTRNLILSELRTLDPSGLSELIYIENKVVDTDQRQRARRDLIQVLDNYAANDRAMRDGSYFTWLQSFIKGIDIEGLQKITTSAIDAHSLYEVTARLLDYETERAVQRGELSNHLIKMELLGVLHTIGTEEAQYKIAERKEDNSEIQAVREKASNLLGYKPWE